MAIRPPARERPENLIQPTQIAIYGAGGCARSVAWLVEACGEEAARLEPACYIDDNTAHHGETLLGLPIMGLEEAHAQFPAAKVVGGIGSPASRQKCMEKAASIGFEYATLVHPRVEMSRWVHVGAGTIICAGCILTTRIKLGQHVQINLDCTIGHDVVMDDYATMAPGVRVSGYVHLGKRVFVGAGAVIVNGTEDALLTIGDDVTIGAGACVTKSIPAGLTVVGVPARPIQRP